MNAITDVHTSTDDTSGLCLTWLYRHGDSYDHFCQLSLDRLDGYNSLMTAEYDDAIADGIPSDIYRAGGVCTLEAANLQHHRLVREGWTLIGRWGTHAPEDATDVHRFDAPFDRAQARFDYVSERNATRFAVVMTWDGHAVVKKLGFRGLVLTGEAFDPDKTAGTFEDWLRQLHTKLLGRGLALSRAVGDRRLVTLARELPTF